MGNTRTNVSAWRIFFAVFITGLSMWVEAGLYHNLLLPLINKNATAHHEGLFIMLISYFILSLLMNVLFVNMQNKSMKGGLFLGVLVGILWVFPHGLTMAGAHGTSILYEIKNTAWHIFEQGIGGIILVVIFAFRKQRA